MLVLKVNIINKINFGTQGGNILILCNSETFQKYLKNVFVSFWLEEKKLFISNNNITTKISCIVQYGIKLNILVWNKIK